MDNALLISRTYGEVRMALLQGGVLTAFQVERASERGVVGNIYKGRVLRVLPGMQAAFVDVGLDRAAFLYVGDAVAPAERAALLAEDEAGAGDEASGDEPNDANAAQHSSADLDGAAGPGPAEDSARSDESPGAESPPDRVDLGSPRERIRRKVRIQDVLKPGDVIVAQVAKDAMRAKGARITRQLTVPGRFLVFIPGSGHVGVSRRVGDPTERARLRAVVESRQRPGEGFIARTACEGRTEDELVADVEYLREVIRKVEEGTLQGEAPALLHEELDLVLRSVRDLLTDEIRTVVLDHPDDLRRVRDFVDRFLPQFADRVEGWTGETPLLEEAGVEKGLTRALSRKVHLKSGAHLVIDHTEALTAIDVNTGRYVGRTDLEDTIVAVNLEAARAIPEQLRLRDIGGLIVVDFIDMAGQADKQAVYDELMLALKGDRARCSVLPISDFGLVQMTRHRVRDDLARQLTVPCAACAGDGKVRSAETLAYEVLRAMQRHRGGGRPGQALVARCPAAVVAFLQTVEAAALDDLARELGVPVRVQVDPERHVDRYSVHWTASSAP